MSWTDRFCRAVGVFTMLLGWFHGMFGDYAKGTWNLVLGLIFFAWSDR